MVELKGNGLPANSLRAAIGDIYTDRLSGKAYKCVFSYYDTVQSACECQWIAAPDKDIPIKKQNNNYTQKETK